MKLTHRVFKVGSSFVLRWPKICQVSTSFVMNLRTKAEFSQTRRFNCITDYGQRLKKDCAFELRFPFSRRQFRTLVGTASILPLVSVVFRLPSCKIPGYDLNIGYDEFSFDNYHPVI